VRGESRVQVVGDLALPRLGDLESPRDRAKTRRASYVPANVPMRVSIS